MSRFWGQISAWKFTPPIFLLSYQHVMSGSPSADRAQKVDVDTPLDIDNCFAVNLPCLYHGLFLPDLFARLVGGIRDQHLLA
jgi:hypothetical protein